MLKRVLLIVFLLNVFLPAQDDINNRFMLAKSFEQAGEYEKAKDILEDIYKRQPNNYQIFDALNNIYLQLKNYDSSEKLISGKLSVNPDDINLWGLLGKTFYLKGDEQKAFKTWDDAISKSTNNLTAYRLMANYAIERRAFNKAIEILEKAKKISADKFTFSYDLANLYSLTMDYSAAASELLDVVKNAPGEVNNVRARINIYIGRSGAMKQTLKVFESEKNFNTEIKSILAWLYTEDKNFDASYELYRDIDNDKGNNGSEIYGFAQYLFSMKEYSAASKVFSDIMEEYPLSPLMNAAKLGYAKSAEELLNKEMFLSSGGWKPVRKSVEMNSPEADKIINIYIELSQKPVNQDLSNEASFRAAILYLKFRNKPDEAEKLFKKIIEYPVSLYAADASIELGLINIRNGRTEDALRYFTGTMNFPRATDGHKNRAKFLMSKVYFFKKDFSTASELLSQILANLKDNSANDALELSLLLNTKMNDSLSLLVFSEAEFDLVKGNLSEAKDKFASISEEKGGFLVGSLSKLREAETELAIDNIDRAVIILEGISGVGSRNIYADKALYLLGNIYEYSYNSPLKAVEIYEKLLARYPASMYLDDARDHIISLKNKVS